MRTCTFFSLILLLSPLLPPVSSSSPSFQSLSADDVLLLSLTLPSPNPSSHSNRNRNPLSEALSSLTTLSRARQPSCFRTAVLKVVEFCQRSEVEEVDDADRVRFAAGLTICEFEAAGVEGPIECSHGEKGAGACVKALERRPQWWTSYSGNYRETRTICSLARRSIEKEQILDLHANLTVVQSQVLEVLRREVHVADSHAAAQEEVLERWSVFLEEFGREAEGVKQELRDVGVVTRAEMEGLHTSAGDVLGKLEVMKEGVENGGLEVERVFAGVKGAAKAYHESSLERWKDADDTGLEIQQRQTRHMSDTLALSENLRDVVVDILAHPVTDLSIELETLVKSLLNSRSIFNEVSNTVTASSRNAISVLAGLNALESLPSTLISSLDTHQDQLFTILASVSARLDNAVDTTSTKLHTASEVLDRLDYVVEKIEERAGNWGFGWSSWQTGRWSLLVFLGLFGMKLFSVSSALPMTILAGVVIASGGWSAPPTIPSGVIWALTVSSCLILGSFAYITVVHRRRTHAQIRPGVPRRLQMRRVTMLRWQGGGETMHMDSEYLTRPQTCSDGKRVRRRL
ncbi:karyogamy protein [Saitoella coloradoensis]